MGMRIGGYGGGSWANHQVSSSINSHQQRQQGVKNLFSALQSGDVNAAQTAFTALQNQGLPANSPLNAIGQALQTGDLASAQKAAQGIMASRSRRGGGHHGDADDAASQTNTAWSASAMSGSATATTSTPNTQAVLSSQSTASALQSSFANLIGSLGGQSSTASVMNFLQGLDASLGGSGNTLNVSA